MKKIFSLLLLSVLANALYAQEEAPADEAPADDGAAPADEAPADDGAAPAGDSQSGESSGEEGDANTDDQYLLINFGKVHDADTEVNFTEDLAAGKDLAGYELPDFSNLPGNYYSEEDIDRMAVNLKLHNWVVDLSESSRSVLNNELSKSRAVTSESKGTVLGVSIHFPETPLSGSAFIHPPFDFPIDYGVKDNNALKDGRNNDYGLGILHNTGPIKSASVEVYGRNYPHGLSVVLERDDNSTEEIFLGYLNFRGWRELKWENPNYIKDVRERRIEQRPLYPHQIPFIRFKGFRIYRTTEMAGGYFIGYFNTVKVVHDLDLAYLNDEKDIDDENFWYIIKRYEIVNKYRELRQLAERRYRLSLENEQIISMKKNPKRGGTASNPEDGTADTSYDPAHDGSSVVGSPSDNDGASAVGENTAT